MTWALAQNGVGANNSVAGNTGTSITISGVTVGNLLVVTTAYFVSGALTPTITDTANNTWGTPLGQFQSTATSAICTMAIYACIANASGATTVKATYNSATVSNLEVAVGEYSGAPTTVLQDGSAVTATGTASTMSTPSITTTGASDLVIEYMTTASTGATAAPWSSEFVNNGDPTGYQLNKVPGTYAAAFTSLASAGFSTMLVALQGPASSVPTQGILSRNTLGRGVRNLGQVALFAQRVPKVGPPTLPIFVAPEPFVINQAPKRSSYY